jgi:glycosyltransferase involved in cell wall biosynthesis
MLQTRSIIPAVLQVIPALDTGGAERTTVDVARALAAAGGKAWIATSGGRLAAEAERVGAQLVLGSFDTKNPIEIWRNAAGLAAVIRANNINIVHARSRAPAWSALLAARRTGSHFLTTYHGIYNARLWPKRFYNSVMARGELVIANSQFTADHVLAEHRIESQKLRVIPRGIAIDAFAAQIGTERLDQLRRQWTLPAGKQVILMPGRLTRWKGQLVFIEALAKLKTRDFVAVMAGDAQERDAYVDELRAAVTRHGLTEHVRIPGAYTDVPAVMKLADVVVAPSIEPEAFGRIAVEAQAAGKPLVASALGAQRETVEDGVTGFLVPPADASALAAAIDRALALDETERKAMALAGRTRVLARYTVEAMCAATLEVYRELLAHHG